MRIDGFRGIADALGGRIVTASVLAGGFSHETCLLTLADGRVVVRFGGTDPAIEAGVMAAARRHVPVPDVLLVMPGGDEHARPAMVIEYVDGVMLSGLLGQGDLGRSAFGELGAEVGRAVAGIGAVRFDRRGFFVDGDLSVKEERPWSQQLAEVAESCMAAAPEDRLDGVTRRAWVRLCEVSASALAGVDDHARLVHADINPKNILVSPAGLGWRVAALLDWEFSYSGCPYGDAANMLRLGAEYPEGFLDGFRAGFVEGQPADLPLVENWAHAGRVLDMFALSDLVTRPLGHPVADQAAEQIRHWVRHGVPDRG
ncbi:phosphotransferase [Plantactinospora sp. KBS50]|uniref:phosphotransferase n=1 Tax=Plantactinospora sp. KBS50 TaxID=2024580 RepID=UPI0012FD165F|nr:phosphotransferase [Plantactinospora sp. KBS50]